jgi:abortive infection bacteriophage resistance protein
MEYNKPALSINDQLAVLKQRGLAINTPADAEHFLNNVSYFRIAAYLHIFEQPDRTFKSGASFEQAATLYSFDVELRKLLFGAVQRIEIALRSRVIHQFSLEHGPFWFLDVSLATDKRKFSENLATLQRELERTKEEFIKEHTAKYGNTSFPPAWKMLELVSFGCLTRLYRNFADTPVRKRIARSFGISKPEALESWMVAINVLRNHCAHHARVWNRNLPNRPQLPSVMRNPWVNVSGIAPTSLYAILCCITYWLNGIDSQSTFVADLKALLAKYPSVRPSAMGFPKDWEQEPLWQ